MGCPGRNEGKQWSQKVQGSKVGRQQTGDGTRGSKKVRRDKIGRERGGGCTLVQE